MSEPRKVSICLVHPTPQRLNPSSPHGLSPSKIRTRNTPHRSMFERLPKLNVPAKAKLVQVEPKQHKNYGSLPTLRPLKCSTPQPLDENTLEPVPSPEFIHRQDVELLIQARNLEKWQLMHILAKGIPTAPKETPVLAQNDTFVSLIRPKQRTAGIQSEIIDSMFRPIYCNTSTPQPLNPSPPQPLNTSTPQLFNLTAAQSSQRGIPYLTVCNTHLLHEAISNSLSRAGLHSPKSFLSLAKGNTRKLLSNFPIVSQHVRLREIDLNGLIKDVRKEKEIPKIHTEPPKKKVPLSENQKLESEFREIKSHVLELKQAGKSARKRLEDVIDQIARVGDAIKAEKHARSLDALNAMAKVTESGKGYQKALELERLMGNKAVARGVEASKGAREGGDKAVSPGVEVLRGAREGGDKETISGPLSPARKDPISDKPLATDPSKPAQTVLSSLEKQRKDLYDRKLELETSNRYLEDSLKRQSFRKKAIKLQMTENYLMALKDFSLLESINQKRGRKDLRHLSRAQAAGMRFDGGGLRGKSARNFEEFPRSRWLTSSTKATDCGGIFSWNGKASS